jgi:hypothetical protein
LLKCPFARSKSRFPCQLPQPEAHPREVRPLDLLLEEALRLSLNSLSQPLLAEARLLVHRVVAHPLGHLSVEDLHLLLRSLW